MESIDISAFDGGRALTLRQAIDTGKLTFRGRKPSLALMQRWANPKRGCRPLGPGTLQVVLPTIITGRERLTMPDWIDWFVRERTRLMVQAARQHVQPPPPLSAERIAKRVERAKQRLRGMGCKV